MSELLPCPFCGGEARVRYSGDSYIEYYYQYWVECSDCKAKTVKQACHIDDSSGYKKAVSRLWNTRTPSIESIVAVVEGVPIRAQRHRTYDANEMKEIIIAAIRAMDK